MGMCTMVRQGDTKIIIDPGVALGPSRYGLPPYPLEIQRMNELWDEIKQREAKPSSSFTHYHHDHHNHHDPNDTGFCEVRKFC